MRNQNVETGEGRRLTAAWLNIIAAGIVSAGTVPLLTALALDGWSSHARALLLLPCIAIPLSVALHMVGRFIVREKQIQGQGHEVRPGLRLVTCRAGGPERDARGLDRFPTESDVDAVLEEFGNDARDAIRALLHDLDAVAADHNTIASRAPSGPRESAMHVR
jgi:hypothetical protein